MALLAITAFFSGALTHGIFLVMQNTYCTELDVSSEQWKIGLYPNFANSISIVSHKQDMSLWHEHKPGDDI